MSSVNSTISLATLCFPDITGATIKAWGTVTFSAGSYVAGGLPMGLLLYADSRTVDFNGFLRCLVTPENAAAPATATHSYRYVPTTDSLQIIDNTTGEELASGASIPSEVLAQDLIFDAVWNRTTTLG